MDLDLEMLTTSVTTLLELQQMKRLVALVVPVHFETLGSLVRRRRYLQLCRMIPRDLTRFLAFRLSKVPSGVPVGRMLELVGGLRPHCAVVLGETDVNGTDIAVYAAAGVRGVGFSAPRHWDLRRAEADLSRYGHQAQKLGLLIAIRDVASPVIADVALTAGFAFIAGDVVGPWVERPRGPVRFRRNDLAGQELSSITAPRADA
jgi:hypothetical protein